jgi:hypothetical protein
MKTIGLVGGVASGKSLVARMLAELGAGLLDADRTGHVVLAEDAAVQRELHERWGDAVFAADGSVDRSAIASRVFAESGTAELDRRFLEELLHKRIRRRLLNLPERTAVNSLIQGSAADMIKLAMIAIWRRLRDEPTGAKMILQIHDELVFAVAPEDIDSLATMVQHEMRSVLPLRVPLKVDVKSGDNWAECQ